ncbi:TonB-dependent receptor [Maricaulis maris MCS10]|jgi:iron complex outermembrane receptor protein|uniref:TonB-dependent receptor n=1 Tax=Maricaulis maris (strain MCS10) TaxID=394221 RepID=Q0ASX9_MARMM|nr:TonB-dependent receptor [Maricaulis maris]ABI64608.1 TonB-dependent receptor [Maricaulis maris MCS10]
MKKFKTLTGTALLLSTVAASALVAAPAVAQDNGASEGRDVITVTARRREETLQDVPLSVTAMTGEDLERMGALDIVAIADTTPNITLEVSRGTNSTLSAFIRGVGQQDPVAGFEAGVGIYVDDVYLNRPQGAVLDIYDVDRIEVLRGPQGTLYGRNTIGGAVKYVTRRIDADEPTLSARLGFGSYGQLDTVLSGSAPLSDTFRVGGTLGRFTRDGYGENLNTGEENYDKNVFGYRVSAEWEPTDSFFVRLAYDSVADTSNARGGHRLTPGALSGAPVLDNVHDTRAGLNVVEQDVEGDGLALTAEWEINENWTVRNILADRNDTSVTPIDFDNLPSGDLDVPAIYENEQFSEEFQLLYSGERLNGLVGYYYLDANATTVFDVLLENLGAAISLPGLNAQTFGDVDTKTWSVFANFTYDLTDEFSLTLGGRYTEDERTSTVLRRTYINGFSEFFGGAGIPIATTSDFTGTNSWDDFSPTASLAWQPNAENNFYVTYSQGFKGGGFDPRAQTTGTPDFDQNGTIEADEVFQFMSFDPETVDSIEIGWKYQGNGYRHSLAVFNMDYTDIQVPGSVGIDTDNDGVNDTFTGVTTNAGAATIRGIEYEGSLDLGQDVFAQGDIMTLGWAIGLLDGEYDQFINAFGVDVSNDVVIQNTPDTTASATLTYITPLHGGDLSVINTISHRGDSSQFEFPFPLLDQGAYTLWNASMVWEGEDGHWQFGLHGRNLTDEEYRVSGYDFVNNTTLAPELGLEGTLIGYYGPPRTVTATIAWRY